MNKHLTFLASVMLMVSLMAATSFAQLAVTQQHQNPFLSPYLTPHQTVPFDKITNTDYLPALQEALAQGRKEVDAIVTNPDKPTFENTVVALDRSGGLMRRVTRVMYNLSSAETTPELQKIIKQASPMITDYANDITLNATLYARVKSVYEQRAGLKLDQESSTLLEKSYKQFARNGANLDVAGKERLRAIDREMAQLSLQFGENVLNETNEFKMIVTDEKELAGLPDFVREAAKATAKKNGQEGYIFTLQAPSYGPFMQYADNRVLRQKLFMAFNARGYHGDKNDNSAIIDKMVNLRYERANLLGYKTHADFVLKGSKFSG
jgi:peptidyl-dipeptidase Dcp